MTGQIGTAPAARRRGGRALALLAAGLLSLAAPLAAPSAAIAHDYLIGSTPEEGSTVSDVPEVISVTSGEPLLDVSGEAGGFALQVRDSSGGYYGDGCLTINGSTLTTPASFGEAGDYTVGWRLVSPDGHTVDGEFAFRWEPAADFEPAPAAPNPPGCGEVEDDHCGVQGQLRILPTRFLHEPEGSLPQLLRILPWCWHDLILSGNQALHQTRGDSGVRSLTRFPGHLE